MKRKFRILGHLGLAVFLVSALLLTAVPLAKPVQAATAVTNVWMQFTQSTYNTENIYGDFTIHFTPTTAMSRGVDKITVWFPDGSTAMGPDNFELTSASTDRTYYVVDANGEASGGVGPRDTTSSAVLSTTGYRITVTTPVDLVAGQAASLRVEAGAQVTTADSSSALPYKIKVYTSQDTTPVASDAFNLDTTGPAGVTLALSPSTAGSSGQYTFSIDLSGKTELPVGGTLTFVFPYGTTIPTSFDADRAVVSTDSGSVYEDVTVAPVIDVKARTITITTPVVLGQDANNRVRFKTGAGIGNPTTAGSYTELFVATSLDELLVKETSGYSVTAGTATKVIVANGEIGTPGNQYSDSASMINLLGSKIWVTMADSYGNAKAATVTVTMSTSGTGTFYKNSNATPGSGTYSTATTISVTTDDPATSAQQVYYRGTAAGTVTLTFAATNYTSATWTFTVAPAVSLYDSSSNLIDTYAPSSASSIAEMVATSGWTTQKYASDYINDAITASVPGDTVKLGDGIYEVDNDSFIDLDQKITLTSLNGASSTTLRNTQDIDNPFLRVTLTDGTSSQPIIIDGFTFQRLRSGEDIQGSAIQITREYVTVRNNIFNNINMDNNYQNEAVIWVRTANGNIDSLTISNNTFNDCGKWDFSGSGGYAVIALLAEGGTGNLAGATISGNTLNTPQEYALILMGSSSRSLSATVDNNTFINGKSTVIEVSGTEGGSPYDGRVVITNNTITGSYSRGIRVVSGNNQVVIKRNTITGGAGNWAIAAEDSRAGTHIIQYNDVYDNQNMAIQGSTDTHDARYNWYGTATGPNYTAAAGANVTRSNPDGTGDKVSDYLTYYPWLHKSVTDVVADSASYQASTVKLGTGWNTLSTPVPLMSDMDSIDELIPSGLSVGYYYSGGWVQITTGYVLSPVDAVYVKMSTTKYALLKFNAKDFSTPSKSLAAGWNLISLASLTSVTEIAAVASVLNTAANLPGYSQVVSPSLNANQTDMLGASGESWSYSAGQGTAKSMLPGLGYWIYMQNADTLVGFELTPIAPDLD